MSGFRFSDDEQRILASVLDTLVPPSADGSMPGAGDVGLVAHVEEQVDAAPELEPVLREGLAHVDALAKERGADGFAALSADDRTAVLQAAQAGAPGLVPSLVFHGYSRYYRTPRVMEAIGLPARPPHPDGYEIGPSDMASLVAPVIERGKIYREP